MTSKTRSIALLVLVILAFQSGNALEPAEDFFCCSNPEDLSKPSCSHIDPNECEQILESWSDIQKRWVKSNTPFYKSFRVSGIYFRGYINLLKN